MKPTPTVPDVAYPRTKQAAVVETHFGQTVSEPYRWLENDVRTDKDVAGWGVLIDPNSWAQGGAAALAEWAVSDDGKHVACAAQDGGTDWRTIRVLDVNTGQVLGDELKRARSRPSPGPKTAQGFSTRDFLKRRRTPGLRPTC